MRLIATLIGTSMVVTSFVQPPAAKAWGQLGHLTVCDLAYRNLTDPARDALKAIMRGPNGPTVVQGRGRLPDRSYTSFNVGCLEEDALPRKHEDDHYINFARTLPKVTGPVCPSEAADGQCILEGIRRDFAILKDTTKSRSDRVFALMAIGHWVGDIHQPLHISFADDKGGNYIDAKVDGKCGTSSDKAESLP